MEQNNINTTIANNLKAIRKNRDLSLDNLAALSGVSKSMLAQIEREESSPSVNTLWKIATALHISFTQLLEEQQQNIIYVQKENVKPLYNHGKKFKLYPLFPYDSERKLEYFFIELEVGAHTISQPHENGTVEYIIATKGCFELTVDETTYVLNEGDGIRYDANKIHHYRNLAATKTIVCMIIYYD